LPAVPELAAEKSKIGYHITKTLFTAHRPANVQAHYRATRFPPDSLARVDPASFIT
jgi:hypothetical protein